MAQKPRITSAPSTSPTSEKAWQERARQREKSIVTESLKDRLAIQAEFSRSEEEAGETATWLVEQTYQIAAETQALRDRTAQFIVSLGRAPEKPSTSSREEP